MSFCKNCGNQLLEQAALCTACGESVYDDRSYTHHTQSKEEEASWKSEKAMAILCYLFFPIPMFSGEYKKSNFVRFHLNQALGVVILTTILWVLRYIIIVTLTAFFKYGIFWSTIGPLLGLFALLNLIPIIYASIGTFNAANAKMKKLPLFGNIKIFH